MPDVYGPFTAATWEQGGWFRDAWARSPSGIYTPRGDGFRAAELDGPGTRDLGLTVAGLTVTMGLGRAHVRGASYERTGTAWSYDVPANTAAQPRRDRLVLRRDLVAGTVLPVVLQGTPAASPVAPALTQVDDGVWELPLYELAVPPNSGAPITVVRDHRAPAQSPRYWGYYDTPNAALWPTVADGAAYGDTLHSRWHGCMFVFQSGQAWRQAAPTQSGDQASVFALRDNVESRGGTLHNGFLIWETSTDRWWVSNGVTPAVLLQSGGWHGAAVTSGVVTPATGWTVAGQYFRRGPNATVYGDATFTRTGAAITNSLSGDFANTTLGTIGPTYRPALNARAQMVASGRIVQGHLSTAGNFILAAVSGGNVSINTGDEVQLHCGYYPPADPALITV